MSVTYDSFIAAFPEFDNTTTYPQPTIEFWIDQAPLQLSARRFGDSMDLATMLFTAHNVVLTARDARAAGAGGIAGEVKGPATSKSVDKVSVSYSEKTSIDGAGAWNSTSYGQRLYAMIRAFGAGPAYAPGPRRYFDHGRR